MNISITSSLNNVVKLWCMRYLTVCKCFHTFLLLNWMYFYKHFRNATTNLLRTHSWDCGNGNNKRHNCKINKHKTSLRHRKHKSNNALNGLYIWKAYFSLHVTNGNRCKISFTAMPENAKKFEDCKNCKNSRYFIKYFRNFFWGSISGSNLLHLKFWSGPSPNVPLSLSPGYKTICLTSLPILTL